MYREQFDPKKDFTTTLQPDQKTVALATSSPKSTNASKVIEKVNPISEYLPYGTYTQIFIFDYSSETFTYKYVTRITLGSYFNVTLVLGEGSYHRELCSKE